ncbi:Respiratory supercomplex factor 1, mitochondrial [Marasmius crinis-equi]|uniref:Respiratory supercomplex factor 1, mitochondrial n=1 Tax=Marasmius crinis-equi TaxID=585013 RepID=A0ABR3FV66_9AGAR
MADVRTQTAPMPSSSGTDPASVYGLSERRFTETYGEKAIRKCQENPLVPFGALATTGALVMSAVRLRGGTSKQFQHWLRARVVFQALTILAVCGGVYKFGQPNIEENQRALEIHKELVETKAARERAEFDERMKQAEIAHAQDQAIIAARKKAESEKGSAKTTGSWWPSWGSSRSEDKTTAMPSKSQEKTMATLVSTPANAAVLASKPAVPSSSSVVPPSTGSSSWLGWLGWKSSDPNPPVVDSDKK